MQHLRHPRFRVDGGEFRSEDFEVQRFVVVSVSNAGVHEGGDFEQVHDARMILHERSVVFSLLHQSFGPGQAFLTRLFELRRRLGQLVQPLFGHFHFLAHAFQPIFHRDEGMAMLDRHAVQLSFESLRFRSQQLWFASQSIQAVREQVRKVHVVWRGVGSAASARCRRRRSCSRCVRTQGSRGHGGAARSKARPKMRGVRRTHAHDQTTRHRSL
mmetsp:Transcript_3992/g.25145  ORF Transcript_3992/g.25145 Transcript_3992/m.25145 type:complete len:214 (-) Transcript_3992:14-655(-)